jgi:hypothetical protein
MTIATLTKGFAGALTATAIYAAAAAPAGAAMLMLKDQPTQLNTPETLVFTATSTESILIDQGYQKNDIEALTINMVTLSGGGPNLLGATWQHTFATTGSNAFTFNDGTLVPALGFAGAVQKNPLNMDTYSQMFATVPGDTYTYTFNYSNNTAGHGFKPSELVVTLTAVPEASTWAMLLLGFAGLGFASYRVRRAAHSIV